MELLAAPSLEKKSIHLLIYCWPVHILWKIPYKFGNHRIEEAIVRLLSYKIRQMSFNNRFDIFRNQVD